MQITIDLTGDQADRLREIADSLGVEPVKLAGAALSDLLSQPDEEFQRAAAYVLKKNQQLYERSS